MRLLLVWLRKLLRLAAGTATALLIIALVVFGWAVLTQSGLRTVLKAADQIAGDQFTFAKAEGRLFGTMTLRDLRISTPEADVAIATVRFSWTPGWLPAATFYLRELHVDDVDVTLHEVAPREDPPAESGPLDIFIPLRVVLRNVTVSDVEITRAGEALPGVSRVELVATAAGRSIDIDRLFVAQPDFGDYLMRAALRLPEGALVIDDLQIEGAGKLMLSGRLPLGATTAEGDAEPMDLALAWEDLHWPAGATGAERLFESPRGALQIGGQLTGPQVRGNIDVAPSGSLNIDASWLGDEGFLADIGWRNLVDPTASDPQWRSDNGRLQASGQPDDWRAELDLDALVRLAESDVADAIADAEAAVGDSASGLPEQLPITLRLQATGDMDSARIASLSLGVIGGEIGATGNVQWTPEILGNADVTLARLDPGQLLAEFPGRINGQLRSRFSMQEAGPEADFDLSLRDSRLRGHALELAVVGTFRDAVVQLSRARLRSAESTLTASGRATPPFALQAALNSPDLGQLVPDIGGSARLSLNVSGTIETLRATIKGELANVTAPGVRVDSADIDSDIALTGTSRVRLAANGISAGEDTRIDRAALALDGRIDNHTADIEIDSPQGAVKLGLAGAADLDRQSWDGELRALSLAPTIDIAPWTLRAPSRLSASAERVHLARSCLSSSESDAICITADTRGGNVDARVEISDFDLAYVRGFLPPGMVLESRIDADIKAEVVDGELRGLDAGIDIAEGRAAVPDRPALTFGPGRISATSGTDGEVIAQMNLPLAGGNLQGDIAAATRDDQALSGNLRLTLPELDFLPLFTGEVSEAAGNVRADVQLGGNLSAPDINLRATLDDGRLGLFTPGIVIDDIRAEVTSDSERQVSIMLRANSGNGELRVDGSADLQADPIRAALTVKGKDFQAANLPEARAWITPDLTIDVAEEVVIRGRVEVPRAEIEPQKFQGGGGEGPSGDQIIVGRDGEEPAVGLPVDARVTVAFGDNVSLDGYGLETRLGGSLTVIQEPNRVTRARGAITLEDGRYAAYGQRLVIERGRIVYAGGPITEPGLDFEAVRTPRSDIKVGVRVRGTPAKPEFQLFSEPTMEQNEQLSWLVLGRPPPDGGQSEGDGSAMAAAALALGLSGGDWLAQQVGGRLGLDEISVGADDGEDGSQARFTVGKYIGPRLYISYGVSIFQPGQIFTMRYDIGRGFAIQTETGVESGGDLLYTLERGIPE